MASAEHNLAEILARDVLVVGDAMLDRYWFGNVERISPEAPVPVVQLRDTEVRLGGAGNVACNITALGGRATLLSIVGEDEAGAQLTHLAQQSNIRAALVTHRDATTTTKLRILGSHQQLLRVDDETPPPEAAQARLQQRFTELLDAHQAVVLSDYGKGSLAQVDALIARASEHKIPLLVDPKGADFSRYRGATVLTPNLKEFERVVGTVESDADMESKAQRLIAHLRLEKLLVTLGERGMVLFARDAPPVWHQTMAREVFDVSGAGDSVIAVLALGVAARADVQWAVALANAAAGVVVSKLGTATANLDELQAALQSSTERANTP